MNQTMNLPLKPLKLSLLVDWDGVVVDSELAKALGWLVAALKMLDVVPADLFFRIQAKDPVATREVYALVAKDWAADLDAIRGMAGRSQDDTCSGVHQLLLPGDGTRGSMEDLRKLRKLIKDPFLFEYSRPILSTVKFLEALAAAGSRICLVTQTTWEDAEKLGKALDVPMDIFAEHECCGDDAYKLIPPSTEKKMLAYARASASAGGQLSNALAIEDSESGLAAASAAWVQCLGLKTPQNSQDLSRAALVVSDLGKFASAGIAGHLANCSDAAEAIAYLRGKVRQRFHVGCSVGGHNFQVAQVLRSGDLRWIKEAAWSQDESCQTAKGLANRLAALVKEIAGDNYVDLVGLSIKGPGRLRDGKLVIGKWAYAPFKDHEEEFQKLFEEALREHGVQFGPVVAMLDNEAALRGEMHLRGGLAGVTSGMIKIWGTGHGCLAFEKGEVLREVRANEPGSDRWRVYSSDGRHLIWTQGRDGFFWYEYRGVPPGETRAPIDKEAGEVFYSERTAGPWGAKIIAANLLGLPEKERVTVLQAMEAVHLDLSEYVGSGRRDLGAETALWAGLTVAALKDNQWARAQITSIGAEEGLATAAFVWEFQEYEFVESIILVSSISERLGKGVSGEDGDLLIGAVQESLCTALIKRGLDKQRARRIAMGVRRSTLGRERELLPFAPPEDSD